MFKKLLLGLGIAGLLGVGSIALVNAQNFEPGQFGDVGGTAGVGVSGAGVDKGGSLIQVIKNFINRILGLLALITLVIVLRGGFKMVTAAGDEGKFKEGFKILKQAGIGLAIIGLSWFVVSIIFRVISGSSANVDGGGGTTGG
ncbi:MAG TPA: hypothetical protein PK674_02905 [Candidatus Absconditabacterales bacterium]|nr:hypothetical protein [Candidatus Absconditabacterales bacterium]HOQ78637.1 hypothetical protein [Candidatus Absconditabacterales bacterium]HPK28280.1 hypothetical protein [Candidatus Absconditabacterales bacterium]